MSDLARFEEFLGTLDMDEYRARFRNILIVELNLPREVQIIGHLYRHYWEKRNSWPDYDEFYRLYSRDKAEVLSRFREKTKFSEESFNTGLPARMYRTWSPILTQIQCGYLAEDVFGEGSVEMSEELDRGGVDIRVTKDGKTIDFQVKKMSWAGVRGARPSGSGEEIHDLTYELPPPSQYTLKGAERVPYTRWKNTYQGKLDVLENGFVVFREGIFDKWR